eukprot:m.337200 g.337200  ORF g.337200 m.337200 type:complete len:82 (-) comp18073_c0_seq1:71-316(-)
MADKDRTKHNDVKEGIVPGTRQEQGWTHHNKGIFGNDNRLSGRLKCINFVSLSSTTPHRFFSCVPIFLIKLLAIRSRQYIM